jgi:ABC-type transport system involved in cytochrome bd biosynthesis fused ATPase/permease subunit
MIGDFLTYAATRATNGAVENVSRRAGWYAAGASVLLCGLFFVVLAAFWTLEPSYGAVQTAGIIAGICMILALLCFVVPSVVQAQQHRRAVEKARAVDPVTETIEAVNVETAEAVDYFGPMKVVLTAFMLGMGAAKQLRGAVS